MSYIYIYIQLYYDGFVGSPLGGQKNDFFIQVINWEKPFRNADASDIGKGNKLVG